MMVLAVKRAAADGQKAGFHAHKVYASAGRPVLWWDYVLGRRLNRDGGQSML